MKIDGNKFIEMGQKFLDIHESQGLSAENLDFVEIGVEVNDACGTIACHGGWGCVIFDVIDPNGCGEYLDYDEGADTIARFLGFIGGFRFRSWADDNAEIWGSDWGIKMFGADGYLAFNSTKEGCDLAVIGNWYTAVGVRLNEDQS